MMRLNTVVVMSGIAQVSAYTSYNAPMMLGNENRPHKELRGLAQEELEKNLPTINIKYRFAPVDVLSTINEVKANQNFDQRVSEVYASASHEHTAIDKLAAGLAGKVSFVQNPSALAAAMSGAKIYDTSNPSLDDINEVIRGIGHVAPPKRHSEELATKTQTVGSCARDYAGCPEGFVSKGGNCVASSYVGPCKNEVFNPATWSLASKVRFQEQCGAFYPCQSCAQDFSSRCPQGFRQVGNSNVCEPTASYNGPCDHAVDFSEYNANMLSSFSQMCGAYWKCA